MDCGVTFVQKQGNDRVFFVGTLPGTSGTRGELPFMSAVREAGRKDTVIDLSQASLPPFAHQIEGVEALVDHPYFFLALDMGLGKSKVTIDSAHVLFQRGVIDRVLIVCPGSVRAVWYDPELSELKKHLWVGVQSAVKHYHIRSKVWYWPTETITGPRISWMVTGFEFIRSPNRLKEALKFCTKKTLLVLDESFFIRGPRSAQTRACMKLRKKCGRVVLLSGTPLFHSPLDLYSQGQILHKSILDCPTFTQYKARYAIQVQIPSKKEPGGWILDPWTGKPALTPTDAYQNIPELQARFKPFVMRRMLTDCVDMPEKLPTVAIQVTLTEPTWKVYRQLKTQLVALLETTGKLAVASNAAVLAGRLSQVTSGFVGGVQDLYDEERNLDIQELSQEKLDTVLELFQEWLINDPCLKLIVWTRHRPELNRLMRVAGAMLSPHIQQGYIYGEQKPADRAKAIQLLDPRTAPDGPVLWGGIYGTGSYGIDLTACHTTVDMSFIYSPGPMEQVGARVYRIGQKHPVRGYETVAYGPNGEKTIDVSICQARRKKQDINTWTASAWLSALSED